MSFLCFHLLKAIKRNRHSRGDGYLGLCLFFNLLQVPALLPNQSSDQTVVGQDLHRNILSSTEARSQVGNYRDVFKELCENKQTSEDSDLHLRVIGLFLHDVHDHTACGGAALRSGVDGDGLLCCSRVLLTMDVHPIRTGT